MSSPKRLHNLYGALSFDERLRLALDALHAGRKQDQQLVETLPYMDREAWSDCLRLLDTTNSALAWYIDHLQMAVTQTELRCALWLALERSATNAEAALLTLLGESSEPVTESEHAERVAEARADYVQLDADPCDTRTVPLDLWTSNMPSFTCCLSAVRAALCALSHSLAELMVDEQSEAGELNEEPAPQSGMPVLAIPRQSSKASRFTPMPI